MNKRLYIFLGILGVVLFCVEWFLDGVAMPMIGPSVDVSNAVWLVVAFVLMVLVVSLLPVPGRGKKKGEVQK